MKKDTKVISLRGRLPGYGVSSAPEDPQMAKILEIQSPGMCLHCGGVGVVDYIDLVSERSKLHCPACQHYWDESLAEPEGEVERAQMAARREAAAAQRRLHR